MDEKEKNIILPWPEWKVEKLLGRGAFGEVYQIVKEEFGTQMHAAVKIIRIPTDESEIEELEDNGIAAKSYLNELVGDIANEIILMQALKGAPNIVEIDDYKIEESVEQVRWTIYIRMELLTDLNRYRRKQTLSYEQIIQLGCDLCNALEICRKKKIIHRDIKPSNIFVSSYGEYKLGDFGISKHTDNTQSVFSTRKGTYSYMAPEVYRGEKYGYSIDLYSLGVVLYQLANKGRLPFYPPAGANVLPGDAEKALEKRNMGIPFPDPVNGGEELGNILRNACHIDPKKRYDSPAEMAEALRRLLPQEETDRTPIEEEKTVLLIPEEKSEKSDSHNHYKVIILAVVALLGVSVTGISAYVNSSRKQDTEKNRIVAETETVTEQPVETESEIITETETESEIVTETESEIVTETETESEIVTETETAAEQPTETEVVTETITETEAVTEKITETEKKTEKTTEKTTETEAEIKDITLSVDMDGEKHKITIQNHTGLKIAYIGMRETDATIIGSYAGSDSETIASWDESYTGIDSATILSQGVWEVTAEKGKRYRFYLQNEDGTSRLTFFGVSLEDVDEIHLYQADNYTYVTYAKDHKAVEDNSEKYRTTMLYDGKKYVLTGSGLNMRELPDNKSGAVVKKLGVASEIEICGEAKGLMNGEETDWYLIQAGDKCGYISADPSYTTDDKEAADQKKAEIQAAAAAAAQQSYSGSSGSSGGYSGGSSGGSSSGASDSSFISSW